MPLFVLQLLVGRTAHMTKIKLAEDSLAFVNMVMNPRVP